MDELLFKICKVECLAIIGINLKPQSELEQVILPKTNNCGISKNMT
jgi:hypothetical protein